LKDIQSARQAAGSEHLIEPSLDALGAAMSHAGRTRSVVF
jgi:hypothetical protein